MLSSVSVYHPSRFPVEIGSSAACHQEERYLCEPSQDSLIRVWIRSWESYCSSHLVADMKRPKAVGGDILPREEVYRTEASSLVGYLGGGGLLTMVDWILVTAAVLSSSGYPRLVARKVNRILLLQGPLSSQPRPQI
jgi:hypothetical protein